MTMLAFRKSSHCEALNQDGCVEVADADPAIAVRNSTALTGPVLFIGRPAWNAFARSL
jgi:hypothetical protein